MGIGFNDYILFALIILSMFFDITKKKIPNFITFPVILWGLLFYTIFEGLQGLKFSGIGFLVGLGIFLIPFIFGGMGGGDVKMLAAIGALKGWRFTFTTAIYTGLIGGLIVIAFLLYKKQFLKTFKRAIGLILKPLLFILTLTFEAVIFKRINDFFLKGQIAWEKKYIPYGVAIGLGAALAYFI